MTSILATGLGAMTAASARAQRAATVIVEAVSLPKAADPTGAPVPPTRPPVLVPARAEVDPLAKGVVDLILARQSYAAGAAIVRTADEMTDETLKLV